MGVLEKMDAFFEARLSGYDEHMRNDIEAATEFYPFTASLLPMEKEARVLDLGCGTGLELEEYFRLNPSAEVTGIDLSRKMLEEMKRKLEGFSVTAVQGSYFDIPFGESAYHAAVSVESLHHFTAKRKAALYQKLRKALREGGYFILTDYFATTDEEEAFHFAELERLKREQGIGGDAFYHYDTPLTVEHEMQALKMGGFSRVEHLSSWGATHTIRAY